jgi:hypothetical protein
MASSRSPNPGAAYLARPGGIGIKTQPSVIVARHYAKSRDPRAARATDAPPRPVSSSSRASSEAPSPGPVDLQTIVATRSQQETSDRLPQPIQETGSLQIKPRQNGTAVARLGLALCFSQACTRVNASRLLLIKAKVQGAAGDDLDRLQADLDREQHRLERLRSALAQSHHREAA